MTKTCVICGNRASETDREIVDPLQKITYHKIPISGERNKKWLQFCGLSKKDNIANKFVCSEHFEKHYLERDLKSELLDGVKRVVLQKEAIPTIKKPKKSKRKSSQQLEEEQRKKRKEEVDKLLSGDLPKPILNPFRQKNAETKVCETTSSDGGNQSRKVGRKQIRLHKSFEITPPVDPIRPDVVKKSCLESLELENHALKSKVAELEQLVEKKNEKISLAKTEMININIALQELKDIENRNLNIRVTELLKGRFTDNQIRKLLCKDTDVTWSSDDIFKAFTLRLYGADVYDYIINDLQYPLPEPEFIGQWVHDCYQQTGLLISALTILKALGSKMDDCDKQCVLLLGRTKVHIEYYYDSNRDQIIGDDGYLYCICVQSILADWHQVVYVDFDLIYSADLIFALINDLYDIHFNVMAITAPCDQETLDLWAEFEVSTETHYVRHPKTDQPIYLFSCAISTFSMLHKTFFESGFLVQDDVMVTKSIVQKLLESNDPEIHQTLAFSKEQTLHLSENITAEDMISHNTAHALKILAEEGEEAVTVLATLFGLFRDWYDLMTTKNCSLSSSSTDTSITQLKYGTGLEEQNIVLDGMYDTIESLKYPEDQDNHVQLCLLVSLNSIKKLYGDLKEKHNCSSISTSNLTLFSLNNIFEAFQRLYSEKISSVNSILTQLNKAILTNDALALSTSILENTKLNVVPKEYKKSEISTEPALLTASEADACSFLTEYVARALRDKYDYLGDQTFVIERKNNSYVVMPEMPTGIIEPSRLWIGQAKKLESYVSDISFYRNENVIENLVNSISRRYPKMGIDIIRMYIEKRVIIKLNNMNKDLSK